MYFNLNNLLIKDGFYIGNFEIKFYGIIIAFGMLIGILMASRLAKKYNIKSEDVYTATLFIIPLAILGARIYYCIFSGTHYTFSSFWNIRQGGLAIYGGVIGGILGIIIHCLIKKDIKLIPKYFDLFVPGLIFAQCLGRWGNFFNQEAYGSLITNDNFKWFPFGVYIDDVAEWHLATFFYESFLNFCGTFLLLFVYVKSKRIGTTTATYLVYYGSVRLIIEGFRTDSLYLWNTSIRVSQALSLIMIVIGISILVNNFFINRKQKLKT